MEVAIKFTWFRDVALLNVCCIVVIVTGGMLLSVADDECRSV